MEKHWYIIVNEKDNEFQTTDQEAVEEALQKKSFKVTEVREHTIYMENSIVRTTVFEQIKPYGRKGK